MLDLQPAYEERPAVTCRLDLVRPVTLGLLETVSDLPCTRLFSVLLPIVLN